MEFRELKTLNRKTTGLSIIRTHIVFFIFIALATSCQKEITADLGNGTTTPPVNSTYKVKTYTEDATFSDGTHLKETFNLSYDSNDRPVNITAASSPGNKFVYQYNANNTYTLDIYIANAVSLHELFYLNSMQLVDSTVQYDLPGKDTTTEKYIYNSSKQLVTLKQYNYSKSSGSTLFNTTDYITNSAGNVTQENSSSGTIKYEFYPDLLNTVSIGTAFFYQNKNLTKTTTTVFSNGSSDVTTHTYTFDSNNRITSEKQVSTGGDIVIRSYTYQ